jgi:dimethylaniline monooxygenase (N-oxide forming)
MLVRTLHWVVPSYSIWGLPFFLFYSTRLAQFLYERPNQAMLRSLLCRLMTPLVSFYFTNQCAHKSACEHQS